MTIKPKRPRDVNQLAKLIVDISTGEVEDTSPDEGKNAKKVASGKKGGVKGGVTRMEALTKEQRTDLARKAASARWGKPPPTSSAGGVPVKSTKQR